MADLSDVSMEGVKPMSENQDLPVGQYLIRIEDSEKKATKERFDEHNNRLPDNHYLQLSTMVYGGTFDGHTEYTRLNLWNTNETAVRMAKAELKSIQDATGVISSNSDHFHGKWMILEVKAGLKDPTKTYKYYHPADPSITAAFAHVPPVPAKPPSVAAQPAQTYTPSPAQHTGYAPQPTHTTHGATISTAAPASIADPNALPDWMKPRR